VIIAIAILAVMMTISYRILRGIANVKRELDQRREGMYIANSILTRMSKEIQLAVKRPLLPSSGDATSASGAAAPRGVFLGTAGLDGASMTFMARDAGQYVPDGGAQSGIVQLRYSAQKDTERQDSSLLSLVREEIPNIKPIARAFKNRLVFEITYNLDSLRFRYFDGQDKQWVETWDGPRVNRLPTIVEYTVTLKGGDGLIQSYTGAVKINSAP
jgi:hypothetical protein